MQAIKICALAALLLPTTHALRGDCGAAGAPSFDQFPAKRIYTGKPHEPVLRTKLEHEFRTVIRSSTKKPVDFAGHFVIARWGCGSGCMEFVVVDVETGRVYDPPIQDVSFHYPPRDDFDPQGRWSCRGDYLTHNAQSRLLIIEGCLDGEAGSTSRLLKNEKNAA